MDIQHGIEMKCCIGLAQSWRTGSAYAMERDAAATGGATAHGGKATAATSTPHFTILRQFFPAPLSVLSSPHNFAYVAEEARYLWDGMKP